MTKRIEKTTYPTERRAPTATERRLGVVTFDELEGEQPAEGVTVDHRTKAPRLK